MRQGNLDDLLSLRSEPHDSKSAVEWKLIYFPLQGAMTAL